MLLASETHNEFGRLRCYFEDVPGSADTYEFKTTRDAAPVLSRLWQPDSVPQLRAGRETARGSAVSATIETARRVLQDDGDGRCHRVRGLCVGRYGIKIDECGLVETEA